MGHRDSFGQRHVLRRQPQCQGLRIWQGPVGKVSGQQMRQFRFTGPFVSDEQQIDHAAAGIPRQIALQDLPGFRIFGAGEQVVAVDRVAQGLRFAAQSMDDMVVIDDMDPVPIIPPTRTGMVDDERGAQKSFDAVILDMHPTDEL